MKKKIIPLLMACMIGISFIAGCKSKSEKSSSKKNRTAPEEIYEAYESTADASYDMTINRSAGASGGNNYYSDGMSMEYAAETEAGYLEDSSYDMEQIGDGNGVSGEADTTVDASKEMLVFRCTMSIDTLNFEESLASLKGKIEEYHGFIERENQSDGATGNGKYLTDEKDKDYFYTATIRIPSEYYESFVNSTSGIGILRSKNSSVDNVSTRYGTLKNELEIFEAEYDRYMKQYEETEDESVALQIQRELRNLAITISDIKTEMSMLESDVAYSYVSITLHKVTEKEIKQKEKEEKKEEDEGFGTRISNTAKESWDDLVGFFESIVLFFVANWWIITPILIAILVLFFVIRHKIKKFLKKRKQKQEEAAAALPLVIAPTPTEETAVEETIKTDSAEKAPAGAADPEEITEENNVTNEDEKN